MNSPRLIAILILAAITIALVHYRIKTPGKFSSPWFVAMLIVEVLAAIGLALNFLFEREL